MNAIKDSIKSGRTVVGTTGAPNVDVSILADAGYDFVLFDTQHSPWDVGARAAAGEAADIPAPEPDQEGRRLQRISRIVRGSYRGPVRSEANSDFANHSGLCLCPAAAIQSSGTTTGSLKSASG